MGEHCGRLLAFWIRANSKLRIVSFRTYFRALASSKASLIYGRLSNLAASLSGAELRVVFRVPRKAARGFEQRSEVLVAISQAHGSSLLVQEVRERERESKRKAKNDR